MTCSQCKHEFCWLCTGPWAEHGERTGGFYNCNRCVQAGGRGAERTCATCRDDAKGSGGGGEWGRPP